jgi:hypothetical protein
MKDDAGMDVFIETIAVESKLHRHPETLQA